MKLLNKKKGAAGADGLVKVLMIAVLAIVGYSLLGGNTNFLGGTQAAGGVNAAGGTGTTTVNVVGDKACASTTVTFANTNVLARGTAPNQYTRVILDGKDSTGVEKRIDKSYVADGGTMTLTGGDVVIAYHAENSTAAQTGYYTDKRQFTIPCTGATSAMTDEGQLYQYDNGLTLSYKNQNGQVNTLQSVAANSKYDFDVTIRSSSQKSFGNPQLSGVTTNALCFKYNNSVITGMDWKVGGVNQQTVGVPQIHSGNNSDTGQTNAIKCYGAPVIKNTEKLEGVLHVESGSFAATIGDAINVTTEDMDYDLNADDLTEIKGVQDEDGNDLGFRGNYLLSIDISS